MGLSRRGFIQTASAAVGALAIGKPAKADSAPAGTADGQHSVLVDTVVCIGCRKCEWACNNQHKLSTRSLASYEDKSVFAKMRRPDHDAYTVVNEFANPAAGAKPFTVKVQCMHCLQPACVSACIVGALKKDSTGPVVYDAWKCIGCRYCMVACPFQIPAYEYHDATSPEVMKCTFCLERLKAGEKPACVGICPNEALTFGTRREMLDLARARIRHHPDRYVDHIYGEHEAGGTDWLYLTPTPVENAGLPILKEDPVPAVSESIQHGIFKSFVPPLALYTLLGLIMRTTRRDQDQDSNTDSDEVNDGSN